MDGCSLLFMAAFAAFAPALVIIVAYPFIEEGSALDAYRRRGARLAVYFSALVGIAATALAATCELGAGSTWIG